MTNIYQEIIGRFERDIESGALRPDSRLPTQRALADEMGVSLGSVTRAYAALEQRGLIRGEGRRGTFVRASPEDALGALATEQGAVDLGRNVPPAAGDPSIQAALRAIANGTSSRLLRYPPTAGWRDHREVGAKWLNAQGVPAESGDVIVTSGAQHGILIVLSALLSAGDVLYAGEVTYPGVLAAAASLGIQVKSVPMDEGGIVPSALAELCRKQPGRALYCIPTLQNPTTAVLSAERKHAIVEIARRNGLWLIEDEIHRMLVRRAPPSFHELWPERAFLISSVSKVVAGGLRVGFLLGPQRHRLLAAVNATVFGGTALAADVFAKLWADGTAMEVVAHRRREAAARQRLAHKMLTSAPATPRGQASHHLWLELREPWTAEALARAAMGRGVNLVPARAFAPDQFHAPNAVRLSLGAPASRTELRRGLSILASVLAEAPGGWVP